MSKLGQRLIASVKKTRANLRAGGALRVHEHQMSVATNVMKRRRNALRELAKR